MMPALSDRAIIDVDYYNNYAGVNIDNYDELIQFINQASRLMETEANRAFRSSTTTEIFHGDGTIEYIVKQKRITTLTTLSYWSGTTWTDITSPNYDYDSVESTGKIYFTDGNKFINGLNNWKVVYDYGWTMSTMPEELKLCCCEIVKWLYRSRKKQGMASETLGDKSVSYSGHNMPAIARSILQKYRSCRYA